MKDKILLKVTNIVKYMFLVLSVTLMCGGLVIGAILFKMGVSLAMLATGTFSFGMFTLLDGCSYKLEKKCNVAQDL